MSRSIYGTRRWQRDDPSSSSDTSDYSGPETSASVQQRLVANHLSSKKNSGSSPSPNRRPFEMASATTSGVKLAQEIYDEFLVCKICLEGYKNPKSLNCLHTFCEGCIENHVMSESTYKKYSDYREFTCPLCRKRTQLPIGGVKKLPDSFLVSSLTEVCGRQKPTKFPFCDICKMVSHRHREASSKCLDCTKLLCTQCVQLHKETKVTANHSIFDVEIEKDIECKEHEDEVVRFYCEPCDTCICVLCTFNEHKDHEISQFGEAVVKYKKNITELLGECKEKIAKFDAQIETLNSCEDVIKEAEQKVHDTAIAFIQEIRNREKQMVDEIKNLYGKGTMEYMERKKDLSSQVEGLRSTCNLTEVILNGKEIELLLLKKDVHNKLSSLNSVDVKELPSTINKKVAFVSGAVDFGYIKDLDRPLLTKMRAARKPSTVETEEQEWPEYTVDETQTDGSITKIPSGTRGMRRKTETDSEDETESESESEDEGEKVEMKDTGMQTEKQEVSDSEESDSEDEAVETKDQETETDEIVTEEKGVNTRSRSLQGTTMGGSLDEEDNSLAARRRRRRERAATTSIAAIDGSGSEFGTDESYSERRKRRSAMYNNHSVGGEDAFYDASSHVSRPRI